MDRKAFARCAAATASIGALLSVGCGNGNTEPAIAARPKPRPVAPPPAVIVSPENDFFEPTPELAATPHRVQAAEVDAETTTVSPEASVPVDPWAVDQPISTLTEEAQDPSESVAKVVEAVPEAVDPYESAPAIAEPVVSPEPIEQIAGNTIQFADPSQPTPARSSAVETIRIELQPAGATANDNAATAVEPVASSKQNDSRFTNSRRELHPVLVTPRGATQTTNSIVDSMQGEKSVAEQAPVVAVPSAKVQLRDMVLTPAAISPAEVESNLTPELPSKAQPVTERQITEKAVPGVPTPAELVSTPSVRPEPVVVEDHNTTDVEGTSEKSIGPESTVVVRVTPVPAASTPEPIAKTEPVKVAKTVVAEPTEATVEKAAPISSTPDLPTNDITSAPAATTPQVSRTPKRAAEPDPVIVRKLQPAAIAKAEQAVQIPDAATEVAAVPAAPVAAASTPITTATEPTIATTTPHAEAIAALPEQRPTVAVPSPAPSPIAHPIQSPAPIAAAPQPTYPAPARIAPTVPLPQVPGTRSPAMVASLAQADERVRHAIQLAEKGAMYASRKEFTAAITLIAQAHDLERGTRQHSQSAAAGFQALKEAHDFVTMGPAEVNVKQLVAGHKTPVLKQFDVSDMPPALAAQYYYGYAKEHLAAGVGRETVGSIALYGLGRIIIAGAGRNSHQMEFTGPAMALYQAALICEPQNFRAAHELGVLLAGSGQLEMAREMLMGSIAQSPQPMMLKNLAVVQSRLGQPQLAAQTQQKAEILEQTNPDTKAPPVQWVDPATFASMGAADPSLPPQVPAVNSKPDSTGDEGKPAAKVSRKRPNIWNPLNLRR